MIDSASISLFHSISLVVVALSREAKGCTSPLCSGSLPNTQATLADAVGDRMVMAELFLKPWLKYL